MTWDALCVLPKVYDMSGSNFTEIVSSKKACNDAFGNYLEGLRNFFFKIDKNKDKLRTFLKKEIVYLQ